ncbi:MAG: TIGR01459 family HAD-type hydrolase [Desulfarculaceae bacterium]|nr:TIGR01459 family HAD-type hydrolase [Desulfarculaceae bacterium]MCF8073197.1 TIGR01459 family HAD-type hydrolase [Desulfarculaceae bacterium]MCF8100793.1 TIGR01459 family HAD-type hydrolase [Desulfarculaceae bacterium]MCF8118440.1 TIGR01459 family HAD-type hydrolase [Desulfarculaceae bacterium]
MRVFPGLAELSEQFRALVLDVWGVLHNGSAPYPCAAEGLRKLKSRGCKVVLVSNTPSTEAVLVRELAELGFSPELYEGLTTSGEITRQVIARQEAAGRYAWHIGPGDRSGLLDGLGFGETDQPGRADFLLVTGFDDQLPEPRLYAEAWDEAVERGLPLYCANPDLGYAAADGSMIPCAGLLARMYEERGGRVHCFGKPRPGIYQRVLSQLPGLQRSEIAAVGDSPATDVRGAKAAELYAVLLANGVAALQAGSSAHDSILALCRKEGVMPDAVLNRFVWDAGGR